MPEQAKNQMMYLVSSMKSQIHEHTNIRLPELYDHDIPMNRNNVDTTCNQFEKLFLDLCVNHGIRILNGRLTGDLFGNYTYYSGNNSNGASAIDYTAASMHILDRFKFLHISDPDMQLSDHCLQSFGIRCEYIKYLEDKHELLPLFDKFKWNQDSDKVFQDGLFESSIQKELSHFLIQSYTRDDVSVNQATQCLSAIMIKVANSKIKRRISNKITKKKPTKLEIDAECYKLRKETRSPGRAVRRHLYNLNVREKCIACSRQYKKLLKKREKESQEQILKHLCTLESKNPKHFCNLVNKLKCSAQSEEVHPDQWVKHFDKLYIGAPDTSLDIDIDDLENSSEHNEILSKPFTIGEIKKCIKLLKNNKASASDLILNKMIKKGAFILLPAFCKLFNLILESGKYPSSWNITY